MNMFCFQCQETAGNKGCTKVGVCGKKPETSVLQDLLIFVSKGVAIPGTRTVEGSNDFKEAGRFLSGALFATITNANFDDERFVGVCIRCGNCLRACPTDIIRLDPGTHGIAGLLTPVLDFTADYCHEDCTRCTEVCPSGALTKLTPEEKPHAQIGLPRVDMNICLLGDDHDCAACRTWCPYDAIKYVFCDDPDVYALVPQIDPQKCPGCGACETACPTQPVKAIVIERECALLG